MAQAYLNSAELPKTRPRNLLYAVPRLWNTNIQKHHSSTKNSLKGIKELKEFVKNLKNITGVHRLSENW